MREINKIAEGLFEKIRDRFEDVSLGDEKAKATQDPQKARFFNFDYTVDDENLGNVTLSIIDEISLKVYFSKNISDDLDDEQRHDWYSFLKELRRFSKSNLLSFEPRDITRSTLKHRDIQQISKSDSTYDKDEVIGESKLYGTSKSSYEKFGPARIIVRHSKPVVDEATGARSRYINSIYVENHEGERFKLPFKSLTGARAMARHVSAGGTPHDDLGQHICEMAQECAKLKPFMNNVRRRTFEDAETQAMVESAFEYHGLLNNTLKRMSSKKGYTNCKEQFSATSTSYIPEDEANLEEMKERFIKRVFNEKMTDALPLVHKAYKMKKENKFTEQFENWAETVAEGTWAVPNTDEDIDKLIDILSKPLPAGVDGQNATPALYNIIGDDRLFDQIEEIAKIDPEQDVRSMITDWLQDNMPQIYQQIENEIGDPDVPAEPAETSSEGGDLDEGVAGQHLSDATAKGIIDQTLDIYKILAGDTKVQPGEQELLQDMYNDISSDKGYAPDDDFEEIENVMYDYIQHDYSHVAEGDTYGSGDGGMDGTVYEEEDDEDQLANIEDIQSAIIRRILNSINDHSELLKKAGPEGIMNAASDVASFHAPMEEIGSSDVSIMVREVYREVGVDYPEDELEEAKDTIKYDPKTGKLTGWEHEGDWKKSKGKKKDPVGKIHHMSDVARRRTEKMSQDETLEEAFDRLVNEDTINVGDIIRKKDEPEIQGKVKRIDLDKYIIDVDGDEYHIAQANAEKILKSLHEAVDLKQLIGQEVYVPSEGTTGKILKLAPGTSDEPAAPGGPKFSNSIVIQLKNGRQTVAHFKDVTATKPGPLQQFLDKIKSVVGVGTQPKYQPKPYGQVSDMTTPQQLKTLSGMK